MNKDQQIGFTGGVMAGVALALALLALRRMAEAWGADTAIIVCAIPVAVIFILAGLACREETRR